MRGASPPLFQLSPPAVVGQWVSRSQLGNTWPSPFLVCCVCVCVFVFGYLFFSWFISFVKVSEAMHAGNISPYYCFLPYSLHWYRYTYIYISYIISYIIYIYIRGVKCHLHRYSVTNSKHINKVSAALPAGEHLPLIPRCLFIRAKLNMPGGPICPKSPK